SRLIAGEFSPELQQWRDAERAGRTLEQHITAMTPVPEATAAADPAGTERIAPALLRPANARRLRSRIAKIALIALAAVGPGAGRGGRRGRGGRGGGRRAGAGGAGPAGWGGRRGRRWPPARPRPPPRPPAPPRRGPCREVGDRVDCWLRPSADGGSPLIPAGP